MRKFFLPALFLFLLLGNSFATNSTYILTDDNQTLFTNSSMNSFYVYEGGSTDRSTPSVLSLFDDWQGSSVNASKWNMDGTATVAGNSIYVSSGGAGDEDVYSITTWPKTTTYVSKCNVTNNLGGEISHGYRDPPTFASSAMYYTAAGGAYDNRPMIYNGASTFGTSLPATLGAFHYFKIKRFATWAEFYVDGVLKDNLTANYPTGAIPAYLNARQQILQCDWIGVYDTGTEPTISYGAKVAGSWTFGAETFTARTQINLSSTGTIATLNASTFTGRNLLLSNETPGAAPGPTNALSVNLYTPANGSLVQNKTINLTYAINASLAPTPVYALLYLDGVLAANNSTTTNATLSNLITTTYGAHTWYVYSYNTTNASMNANSSLYGFEVFFNATATAPGNNTILQGSAATLFYSTNNLHPINCTTYLDSVGIDTRLISSSSSISIFTAVGSGTHTWYAGCSATDANYSKNTSTLTFSMNFASYSNTLNLTNGSENVLSTPQALFYDINGNLNVLYFTDESPSLAALRIKTIQNGQVTYQPNLSIGQTSDFFLVMREANQTVLLTYNRSNTAISHFLNLSGNTLNLTNGAANASILGNTLYDPYTYAYTKQYPTLSLNGNSYYLFTEPRTGGSLIMRRNISSSALEQVETVPISVAAAWMSLANDSSLSTWYFINIDGSGHALLRYYNGTAASTIAQIDDQGQNATVLNDSMAIFESFDGMNYLLFTYTGAAPTVVRTFIYRLNDGLTYNFTEQVKTPSHFFFVDNSTFIFFNTAGGDTYAYSCYFTSVGNCSKYSSSQYGIAMPYDRGAMATSKLDGTSDVVAKGQISASSIVQLLYNLNTYDAKYRCFNEMDEARKLFQVQIFTNTSANILQNESWGYVIPSAELGAGLKKSFFTCTNGTQRMFLSGLGANFTINAYSLNNGLGAYYTITVVDQFGQPVAGAKISAYRFSPQNNAFVVIEQALTDSNGNGVLYLQPFTLYRLTIEQGGYVTLNFDFTPTAVTSISITLSSASSPLTLPDFYYLWDDISYSLTPSTSFSTNATNITYQVSSNSSGLEYFGLEVIRTFPNGTKATVFSNNVSGQPSGGILTYPITTQGSYSINPYFKLQNFSQYAPFTKIFKYQNSTMGFLQARDLFNSTQPITGWVFYLIAVVVAMLAVGFASKYTGDGAGLVGLAVLWGFSLFNPAVEIVCVAGLAGTCITPVIATAFATVATIAALYAKQYL